MRYFVSYYVFIVCHIFCKLFKINSLMYTIKITHICRRTTFFKLLQSNCDFHKSSEFYVFYNLASFLYIYKDFLCIKLAHILKSFKFNHNISTVCYSVSTVAEM